MDLTDLPVFGALNRRMKWLNKRQALLAENVSNANTPGYRARDLKAQDFRELVLNETNRVSMRQTAGGHVAGTLEKGSRGSDTKQQEDYEILLSGNSVNLEEEMVKVAETQIEYQSVTGLYRKQMGLLKIALGKAR